MCGAGVEQGAVYVWGRFARTCLKFQGRGRLVISFFELNLSFFSSPGLLSPSAFTTRQHSYTLLLQEE
jgi:hypothetical protein